MFRNNNNMKSLHDKKKCNKIYVYLVSNDDYDEIASLLFPSDETVRSDCNLASGNIMQNNSETSLNIPSSVTPGLNNTAWNRQQAVCVRNAFKTYGSSRNPNHILQNLNMTVAKGSM